MRSSSELIVSASRSSSSPVPRMESRSSRWLGRSREAVVMISPTVSAARDASQYPHSGAVSNTAPAASKTESLRNKVAAKRGKAGEEVTLDSLASKNLARGRFDVLKVLGDGELKKKLKISAHRFSESAAEKIKQAGGEMVLLPGRASVEDYKAEKKAEKKAAAKK